MGQRRIARQRERHIVAGIGERALEQEGARAIRPRGRLRNAGGWPLLASSQLVGNPEASRQETSLLGGEPPWRMPATGTIPVFAHSSAATQENHYENDTSRPSAPAACRGMYQTEQGAVIGGLGGAAISAARWLRRAIGLRVPSSAAQSGQCRRSDRPGQRTGRLLLPFATAAAGAISRVAQAATDMLFSFVG